MHARGIKQREDWLLERADHQFGLLRHEDLLAAGLDRGAIASRLDTRRLNRIHHKVYAFGHTALREEGEWLAALWACDGALLSHWTAARYHGCPVPLAPDEAVHLSTAATTRSRPGITVHRVHGLPLVDTFTAGPFRVTTIPRTFVDLADVMPWTAYRALADAQRHLHVDRIREAQARAGRRVGRGLVTRLIEADDAHTKSEFERRFLRFLAARRLPRPSGLNVPVAGHKADCHYAVERLVVELDGRAFHARRAAMRADRHRDTDYQLSGHRIMRLVWDDLHPDQAPRTADTLGRMLAAGSA